MERLVQAIMMEVNGGGSWNPVKLVRNGPNISHLFFADDLVLFARALREQMVVIEKLLVELCQCLARQDVVDSQVWIWDNKPRFSVSSAYDILTLPRKMPIKNSTGFGSRVVFKRIEVFLWLLVVARF
ncbi:uncharacterized protein [Gossypium hirsutum]|uniref:Reverse transcriptase domain-containing protein n=1 Tax=Gossypium hirsutum TaxID=3635 RepID=A0A1U8PJ52_GOSHI|nr:uncharacterized protein LOC107959633 [Gossypium hirsutum]